MLSVLKCNNTNQKVFYNSICILNLVKNIPGFTSLDYTPIIKNTIPVF